ncbi:MurR/RpiR family transcriptional regulator [Calditrichota bacterium LG25]
MADLSYYKKIILDNFDKLTKNQKKIAQFLLDHPEEIALSSIENIAEKLNVGKATIVRLAQTLGYKGFLELKTELSNKLRDDLSPTQKFKNALKTHTDKSDFIRTLATNEMNNIQKTIENLDRDQFNKAVRIFVSATNIFTMGLGISSFLAEIASYYLNRVTMRARAFTHGSLTLEEQIISLKKDDALLVISLPPYSYQTIEATETAQYKGVKIVSITDKITSPIAQYCDVVFIAETNNIVFINTVGAILTIIYSLAAGIGLSDRATSLTALSLFEKVESDYGFDIHSDFFK